MEEEKQKKMKGTYLVAPIISIAAFLMLIFGAGYAYFNATTTMATANYQINMPSTTSLVCSKTDCSTTITPAQMANTAVDADNAKASSTCNVNCVCSGTSGAKCNYTVSLKQIGTNVYGVSPSVVTAAGEFTTTITRTGSSCTLTTANVKTNADFYGTAGKSIASCSLTAGSSSTNTSTVQVVFKWYNKDADQTVHAGKVYKYELATSGGSVG